MPSHRSTRIPTSLAIIRYAPKTTSSSIKFPRQRASIIRIDPPPAGVPKAPHPTHPPGSPLPPDIQPLSSGPDFQPRGPVFLSASWSTHALVVAAGRPLRHPGICRLRTAGSAESGSSRLAPLRHQRYLHRVYGMCPSFFSSTSSRTARIGLADLGRSKMIDWTGPDLARWRKFVRRSPSPVPQGCIWA